MNFIIRRFTSKILTLILILRIVFENNLMSKFWAAKGFNTMTLETDLDRCGELHYENTPIQI